MNDFKYLALTNKRKSTKQTYLPIIKRSISPTTQTSPSYSRSPATRKDSKRSISTDRVTLPDLKNSKSGSRNSPHYSGKASDRPCGVVKGYAVNSYAGRHHNEDRIRITINIPCPSTIEENIWPSSSFYGIYDGHSGRGCSEFLKKNLADFVIGDPEFPRHTKKAIFSAYLKADQEFLQLAKETGDMSGSCALVVMIIGDKCFVANTGDSRAIISLNQGKVITAISNEHRPGDTAEYNRIIEAGGKVYSNYMVNDRGENVNFGPHLLAPGKLKVSRAIGDIDAKELEYGGNPKVLIPDPQIKSFPIRPDQDFILLATASVFEKLNNREICDIVFRSVTGRKGLGMEALLLSAVEDIFTEAVSLLCDENMSIILIALKGLKAACQDDTT